MQRELELLQPQLVVAADENEKMLIVIERESKDVETKSEKVRGEEALANEQAAASQALKEECEADLAEAIPALNAALAALDTLKVTTVKITTHTNKILPRLSVAMKVGFQKFST